MLDFSDVVAGGGLRRLLVVGAHSDDIEIGAGATVLRLIEMVPDLEVDWAVASASGERMGEAERSAAAFCSGAAGLHLHLGHHRERYLPYDPSVKEWFDALGQSVAPDLVLCPRREDLHQDHATISALVDNTFRDHLVLRYEIPKYDGDLGQPNVFVEAPLEIVERKIDLLFEHFPSQVGRYWFTRETFSGLMRLRGVESRAASGYAEGFHARKLVLF